MAVGQCCGSGVCQKPRGSQTGVRGRVGLSSKNGAWWKGPLCKTWEVGVVLLVETLCDGFLGSSV